MPTYDYKCNNENCTNNQEVIEVVHRISDPKPNCSCCGEQMCVYYTTTPLVQYKGKWYCKGKEY